MDPSELSSPERHLNAQYVISSKVFLYQWQWAKKTHLISIFCVKFDVITGIYYVQLICDVNRTPKHANFWPNPSTQHDAEAHSASRKW